LFNDNVNTSAILANSGFFFGDTDPDDPNDHGRLSYIVSILNSEDTNSEAAFNNRRTDI
jgi:hypothetical protein